MKAFFFVDDWSEKKTEKVERLLNASRCDEPPVDGRTLLECARSEADKISRNNSLVSLQINDDDDFISQLEREESVFVFLVGRVDFFSGAFKSAAPNETEIKKKDFVCIVLSSPPHVVISFSAFRY